MDEAVYHASDVSDYVHECRFVSEILARPSTESDVLVDPSAPSAIRVFGKSMHVLGAGWFVSVMWLCTELQQYIYRHYEAPPYFIRSAQSPARFSRAVCRILGKGDQILHGKAPSAPLERREWWHAFWWSAVPNILLLITVWVMIQEAK